MDYIYKNINGITLKFNKVTVNCLVKGNKYMVVQPKITHVQMIVGRFEEHTSIFTHWTNVSCIMQYNGIIEHVYRCSLYGFNTNINNPYSMYELVSSKKDIQNAMEIRAVNKVLYHIMGDNHFVYN